MTYPKMDDKLLPCPFCGDKAGHVRATFPQMADYVMCLHCNNSTAMCDSQEQAEKLWNRRALRQDSSGGVGKQDVDAAWEAMLNTQIDQRPNNRDVLNNLQNPREVEEFCKYVIRFVLSNRAAPQESRSGAGGAGAGRPPGSTTSRRT